MMFELCNKVRKKGLIGIEDDIEKPAESEIFKKYPEFLKDHHAEAFVCDTLRTAITGGVEPFDMDQMMELDMEVAHHEVQRARERADDGGRRAAWIGHCCCRSRGGYHHGFAGRSARGDWQEGRCSPPWDLSRHPVVLRPGRANGPPAWPRKRMRRTAICMSFRVIILAFSEGGLPRCWRSKWEDGAIPETTSHLQRNGKRMQAAPAAGEAPAASPGLRGPTGG